MKKIDAKKQPGLAKLKKKAKANDLQLKSFEDFIGK